MRLLFVEDNAFLTTIVQRTLQLDGIVCRVAETKAEALACLAEEAFDVVLLDAHLGHETASEVWPALSPSARGAILIGTSAQTDAPFVERFLALGAAGFLGKPFDLAWLGKRLRELVALARAHEKPVFPPSPPLAGPLQFEGVDRDPALAALLAATAALLGVPIALVTELDGQVQHLRLRHGVDRVSTSREHAFCAYTTTNDDVFIVEDAQLDARFAKNPYVVGDPHIRFYAGAPIRVDGMAPRAALCLIDRVPRTLDAVQRAFLQALAAHLASLAGDASRRRADLAERLLDAAGEWVAVLDGARSVCFANAAWHRGFGLADVLGRDAGSLFAPEDAARFDEVWRQARAGEDATTVLHALTPGGARVPLSIDARWVGPSEGGELVVVARDESRRMAAEQRRRAVSRAVSEQIRAPIALARGTLEVLAAVGAAAEARDAAADASTTLATALGRVDDLLSIEAPDGAVGSGAAFRRLEVDELATEALRAPSAEGARAGVAVELSKGAPLRALLADRAKAIALLERMLAVAVRATPSGGCVALTWRTSPEGVVFELTRQPVGVEPSGAEGLDLDVEVALALARAQGALVVAEAPGTGHASVRFPWSPPAMRLDPRALEDAAKEFRREVLAVLPGELAEIERTVAARDPDAADLLLHRIVGNAHTAGLAGVATAARRAREALGRVAWAAAAEHVGELRQAVATAHDVDSGRGAP